MRAAISSIDSSDVDFQAYSPSDDNVFGVLVTVLAGPEGGKGFESFDVVVCSPEWLAQEVERVGPIVGRYHLIVNKWDPAAIREWGG